MNCPFVPGQVGSGLATTWNPYRDLLSSDEDIIRWQGTWVTSMGLLRRLEEVALARHLSPCWPLTESIHPVPV